MYSDSRLKIQDCLTMFLLLLVRLFKMSDFKRAKINVRTQYKIDTFTLNNKDKMFNSCHGEKKFLQNIWGKTKQNKATCVCVFKK